ncbi:MAG TPA: sulfotransferase [Kofleriaceae bacterium]|nr:sulfotransferase [Kofleriaceae bacterium]
MTLTLGKLRSFNIVKSRELLIARLKKEACYLFSDLIPIGREAVQPFVVIGRHRTGSNMLRYALETHPQVVQYGELFNGALQEIAGAYGKYAYRPQSLLRWRRTDARAFLNDVIYRDVLPPISAVGFKLFYRHGRNDGHGNPWPVLRERGDVRIIHLVRQNPIASFLSNERIARREPHVAMRSSRRTVQPAIDLRPINERIVVDIQKFKTYLATYESDIRTFTDEFRGRAILELHYEAMVTDTDAVIDSVLAFLGVERRPLRLQTERQTRGHVLHGIVNLDEVAAAHRGTRWERVPEQWTALGA